MSGMHLSDEMLAEIIEGADVDAGTLTKELKAIAERGYAYSRSEMIQGAAAVAAPFFDRTDQMAGSLVV